MPNYLYILHTDRPLADHARHYCGATSDLLTRLRDHATGRGARITQVFKEQGIGWRVAAVYVFEERTQFDAERLLKRQKETHRFCPLCSEESGLNLRCIAGGTMVEVEALGIPLTAAELAASASTKC